MVRVFIYLVLLAGIGNAVLRPELGNPWTLYRLMAPVGLLLVVLMAPRLAGVIIAAFVLFAVHSYALASAYRADFSQLYPSLVHFFYIFNLVALVIFLSKIDDRFEWRFERFIVVFFGFVVANLLVEMAWGNFYPNLYLDESGDGSVRAFFWNQNDLAVVLCMMGWFALVRERWSPWLRIAMVGFVVLILYINDSKAALMSFVLVSLPVFMMFGVVRRTRVPRFVWAAFFSLLAIAGALLLHAVRDVPLSFSNEFYTLDDLVFAPLGRIFSLEASSEMWGSISNRTDATIFVLMEYFRSGGLGLGAGGSWLVLSMPEYRLGGAESPHNAILQFVVDFGYPVLIWYAWALCWAWMRMFGRQNTSNQRLKIMAILSFPLLGLSQSGAIVTNYFFWMVATYIWLLDRPLFESTAQQPVRLSATASSL